MPLLLWPLLALFSALTPPWMPAHAGDRWRYAGELREGSRNHPNTQRWIEKITTVAVRQIRQGTLVLRTVESSNKSFDPVESNILISGNCAYYLNDSDSTGPGYGWNPLTRDLTPNFQEDLEKRQALPDVCLPFHPGSQWGDPQKGRDIWTVAARTRNVWRLEAHLSSGDDNYLWFQPGVGIVAKRNWHNGTYYDFHLRLLRFQPAPLP